MKSRYSFEDHGTDRQTVDRNRIRNVYTLKDLSNDIYIYIYIYHIYSQIFSLIVIVPHVMN